MAEAPHQDARDAIARPERLEALRRAELLDTPPEEAFERLTRMATAILGVPVSLVSLVDEHRQFFKSARGLPEPWASARQTPLTHSFCQHVVSRAEPLVVADSRLDPLVRDNAAIGDLGVIAYAGVPIESVEGEVIGSLCAIDSRPRQWTPEELTILRELASLARTELDLRRALRATDAAARAAARASAERTAVIESSTDGIYAIDTNGCCTLANSAAAALLGYAREELLGRNMHDLVHHHHGDGRPFPEAECPLFLASRGARAVRLDDTVLWRRDGSAFPADCTSSPLLVDGQLTGAVVAFRDVTERVTAARALRESEMKFRAVFEDVGLGVAITSVDGRILDCNHAYERITGYTRDALRELTFDRVTHPDDVAEQRRQTEGLRSGASEQLQMEKRYVRPDGSIVWGRLTATAVRNGDGEAQFLVAAVEDVTARLRAVEALRLLSEAGAALASSLAYEDTLPRVARLALPRLGDACIVDVLRPDGTMDALCIHVDPAREEVLRDAVRSPDSLAPASVDDVVPTGTEIVDDLDATPGDARAADAAAGRRPLDALRAAGLRVALRVPLRGQRRALGVLTFGTPARGYDAEDVRLAEALAWRAGFAVENALLYRDAQSATRLRDEVLAVVSHDLRNPVHTIIMSAGFLSEMPSLEPGVLQAQLAVIRRSAARAERLIRDLLDVTRIENGQLRVERQPVPVGELLAEATGMVASQARERRIGLDVQAPDAAVTALGDRHRLLQALDNLLGNALKFTPPGGNVTVAAADDGAGVRFEVRDTGPGMTPAQQANLFRRFWQARRVDRRGVGLGLTIVKGIVDAHGGEVVVESDGRTGTTFRFTVPHEQPAAAAD